VNTGLGTPRRHPAGPADTGNARKVRLAGKAAGPPFGDVLCAVEGGRGGAEAARQAAALSRRDALLRLAAVDGAESAAATRRRRNAIDRLLAESAGGDLLAIDCHGGSRPAGTMLDGTATQVAHRATVPLLIARRSRDAEGDFPRAVLLASDGSPGSWAAARLAARIARARGSSLQVVYVPDGHPERYRELFKQVSEIESLTGSMPAFLDAPGDPARRIAETARAEGSSLVVIGRRGRDGPRSLGSVSERVAQRAPCSVLIVPAAEATGRRGDSQKP